MVDQCKKVDVYVRKNGAYFGENLRLEAVFRSCLHSGRSGRKCVDAARGGCLLCDG